MGFREIVDSWIRVIKTAEKPERSDYINNLKISLLGLFAIGLIAFIIRFIIIVFLFPQQ
ncbi:MAG: preprotein translocase subunit SecE [Desulfurococcaceae archaeon]|uniref:Preprotein translocase subunit SecE n=1 Tax=Staphylothermus marinus TaxID=2280 RepID=A0A7C4NNU8_STAMA